MSMADPPAQDAFVYTGSVYIHQYDASTQGYRPLSESALGLAVLGSAQSYRVFCYNRAQEEIMSTPLHAGIKFTPQQDHYVNFYDAKNQNFSMRFKDDAQVALFLQAIACVKLQLHRGSANSKGGFDEIRSGEGYAVQHGDIVGVSIEAWNLEPFMHGNPADLVRTTPILRVQATDDLHKIKLGDESTEGIVGISSQLVGMQKGSARYVYVPVHATSSWVLAYVELYKVKKEKRSGSGSGSGSSPSNAVPTSASPSPIDDAEAERRDELVTRMAHLARMGSTHAGIVLPPTTNAAAIASRRSSQQDLLASTEPLPGVSPVSVPPVTSAHSPPVVTTSVPTPSPTPLVAAAQVSKPLDLPAMTTVSVSVPGVESLRKEQENLLQEQQQLARMKKELEEARQRALDVPPLTIKPANRSPPVTPSTTAPTSVPVTTPTPAATPYSSVQDPLRSSLNVAPYNPYQAPPATPPFAPYSSPYMPLQAAPQLSANVLNSDMDATLQKVQRTTLSMEGMLIDMQRKMDRLLSAPTSSSVSSYNSYSSRRSLDVGVGSTNSLVKSIERALADSDALQEDNARLTHQVQELQRYNRQLQDDIDRLHADSHRHSDRSAYAGEVQRLQLALDNANQRCAQMESDVQRWTTALERERAARAQLEQDTAALQRQIAQQTQAQEATKSQAQQEWERKLDEARNVAVLAQKKIAEEKESHGAVVAQLTTELRHLEEQTRAQSGLKVEVEQLRTQLRVERESHERDANEAKMHLEELVHEMTSSRSRADQAERAADSVRQQLQSYQDKAREMKETRNEMIKQLMNDIYFACQDAFEEEAEFTGKEVALQLRKILKQQTTDILAKMEAL